MLCSWQLFHQNICWTVSFFSKNWHKSINKLSSCEECKQWVIYNTNIIDTYLNIHWLLNLKIDKEIIEMSEGLQSCNLRNILNEKHDFTANTGLRYVYLRSTKIHFCAELLMQSISLILFSALRWQIVSLA